MYRARSITSIGLLVLFAACSSGGGQSSSSGGSQGNGSGGSQGSGSGGSQGSSSGGSQGNGSGGSQGNGSGGSQGDGSGGSQGNGSGGSQGSGSGGSQGSGSGGSQGNGSGGSQGGSSSGGSQGSGSGGSQGSGSGGAAPATNTLVTSTNGTWTTSAMWTEASSGTADVTVNDATAAQTWEGFGGCFNEMGWNQLSTPALQDEAVGLLFGTDGAHFTMGRIPIGSSDYAMSRYTLDDATTGEDPAPTSNESNRPAADTSLAKFSIDRDKEKLIPYIKAALKLNPDIRLWASPWTPPVWMKSSYKKNSGADSSKSATKPSYFDGGNMKNDDATLSAHAQYLVKFVQAYKEQGISIDTIAPQNEPGYDLNYPSCLWDKTTYTTYVGKYLGPALKTASLSTKIMLGTNSNSDAGKDSDIISSVMNDAMAKPLISSIGVQWGILDNAIKSPLNYNVPVWATEHKCGNYPWNPSGFPAYKTTAPNDQAYAVESWGYIRDAINKAKVTAYNAWNMVLDNVGKGLDTTRDWAQDALLTVSGGKITKTQAYYVFRHFSQFVDPGAKVVGTSGSTDAVAFKNPDGSLVAVVYSKAAKSNYIVAIGGKKLQFSIPADGWATVKYKP